MPVSTANPTATRRLTVPHGRPLGIVLLALVAVSSGCSRLRLPAIDPSGSCLFAPLPTTTTLALPGSAGESCGCLGCLGKLGTCLTKPFHRGQEIDGPAFVFPEPAFPEPEPPPPCATPATPPPPKKGCLPQGGTEACVPSTPCSGDCLTGPPAVLIGSEIDAKHHLHLPDRGKRGCILLSPQKVIAPVDGEVILLSGICGTDGYLQTGEPLEWMLTPDSVGTFLQVGDDETGLLHQLAGVKRPEKQDGSFARGVTSFKRTLITRGNLNRRDDVQLEKGQTWISISSPSEGTSHVTVLAPESECWDQRKATATIYWVDARWQFPAPQRVPSGTPVALTTRVTKAEGSIPATGWRVRYEILQPELARFAGTDGSTVVEVEVNESGNATAELVPLPETSGNAVIDIQVIRPAGESGNMPRLTIGRGQAFVTWSAPQLRLRAAAPQIATYNAPFDVVANVANPGNQPAENVRVEVVIPPGANVVEADAFAQVLTNRVIWDLDVPIPPQQQLDLTMRMSARQPVQLRFQARGDGDLYAEDTVRVDIYRPSLDVSVSPERDRYEAGEPIRFNVAVSNTGDRPLADVQLRATGDTSLLHLETNRREVLNDKTDGPLQPGEVWRTSVDFVASDAGRRCLTVEATAEGGQRATAEGCVTVINPPPVTPALTTTLEAPPQRAVGESVLVQGRIVNSGRVTLRNVEASMSYFPDLRPLSATRPVDQSRVAESLLRWQIPEVAPGQSVTLEGVFEAVGENPRSQVVFTARSAEGASDSSDVFIQLLPGTPPAAAPETAPPALPPAQPPPTIPGGPPPQQANPPLGPGRQGPVAPPLATRSGQLQLSLLALDNPAQVNAPIRLTLAVINDRDVLDSNVRVSFDLPAGVSLERVAETTNPDGGAFKRFGDTIILEDIRSMRPGERVNYSMVLRSNQVQTFDLTVNAVSRLAPEGVSDRVTVDVVR